MVVDRVLEVLWLKLGIPSSLSDPNPVLECCLRATATVSNSFLFWALERL